MHPTPNTSKPNASKPHAFRPDTIGGKERRNGRRRATGWRIIAIAAMMVTAATPAVAESLDEALALAYSNNPRLDAQRARLRATDEQVPQALAGWRPTVDAYGAIGKRKVRQNERTIGFDSNSSYESTDPLLEPNTVAGEVSQPLFRGGQTIAQTREAEHNVRAERFRLLSAEQSILLDAATAYMDVFRDQSELELNVRNEQRLKRQLEATRDRFQVGEVTRTDVFQAEARLARATAERIQSEGRLESSRASYRNVVGQAPEALTKPPLPQVLPKSLDEAIDTAIANNPDVGARVFDERSALDTIDRVRGQFLPTLRVVGRVERLYEESREEAEYTTFEAMLRMDVPIYTAGTTYSQMREAKQTAAERRRQLDAAQRETIRSATDGWSQLETARAAIVSREKQVEANQVALEGVQREAEVGARTVLDILDAEQELLDSQVNLVRAQRDQIVAAYTLKTAVGEMTAQNLGLNVPFYDPTQHYQEVRGAWFGSSSTGDVSSDFDNDRTTTPTR